MRNESHRPCSDGFAGSVFLSRFTCVEALAHAVAGAISACSRKAEDVHGRHRVAADRRVDFRTIDLRVARLAPRILPVCWSAFFNRSIAAVPDDVGTALLVLLPSGRPLLALNVVLRDQTSATCEFERFAQHILRLHDRIIDGHPLPTSRVIRNPQGQDAACLCLRAGMIAEASSPTHRERTAVCTTSAETDVTTPTSLLNERTRQGGFRFLHLTIHSGGTGAAVAADPEPYARLYAALVTVFARYSGDTKPISLVDSGVQGMYGCSGSATSIRHRLSDRTCFSDLQRVYRTCQFDVAASDTVETASFLEMHCVWLQRAAVGSRAALVFLSLPVAGDDDSDPIDTAFPEPFAEAPPGCRAVIVVRRCRQLLSVRLYVDRCNFNSSLMHRFARHLESLFRLSTARPDTAVLRAPLLSQLERKQQLVVWNETFVPLPDRLGPIAVFCAQVKRVPDRPAVSCGSDFWTFRQLDRVADTVAASLQQRGARGGQCIGLCIGRSCEMVAAIIAILKCGASYAPLDPATSRSLLRGIITDCHIRLAVVSDNLMALFEATAHDCTAVSMESLTSSSRQGAHICRVGHPDVDPRAAVYTIFTSGATGRAKGVVGTGAGLMNRIRWGEVDHPLTADDLCCHKTSLQTVDHVAELFAPLLAGRPIVIMPEAQAVGTSVLIGQLAQRRITRIVLLPSQLRQMVQAGSIVLRGLAIQWWFCSGEPLSIRLVSDFYDSLPDVQLYNIYGSTEVAADATWHKIDVREVQTIIDGLFESQPATRSELISQAIQPHQRGITAPEVSMAELSTRFCHNRVPEEPIDLQAYQHRLVRDVFPYAVNTGSPVYIGHMTSALPHFTHDFSQLISHMNQNVVKVESSKSLTLLEREAIAMLHRAFYGGDDAFYLENSQQPNRNFGMIVSGGTTANLTALWCARNALLPEAPDFPGVARAGLSKALAYYGYTDLVILGSRLVHYSVDKVASLLGIGSDNIIHIDQDEDGRADLASLQIHIGNCRRRRQCILAVIGLAGSTETGCVDPLSEMAAICRRNDIHFHVDAAWGGPVIFSQRHRGKLAGIEEADSITVCGHKQLYLPLGISVCLFQRPEYLDAIASPARYQARAGGYDFGRHSPEGSRPALSLLLHAALHVIGRVGYEKLIDNGIAKARYMADRILDSAEFELIDYPTLNVVNYQYVPRCHRSRSLGDDKIRYINHVNAELQERQFLEGRTFISRTTVRVASDPRGIERVVLRAVLSNPMTTRNDIDHVLRDQIGIAERTIESQNLKHIFKDTALALSIRSSGPVYTADTRNASAGAAAEVSADDVLSLHTAAIGRPIINTQVFVLDAALQPIPRGLPGELCIAGIGLAAGYMRRPDLTAGSFLPNSLGGEPGTRMYRTGDIVRYLADGNLLFLGRKDNQLKIGGFRFEPEEIESALVRHPAVAVAAVVCRGTAHDEPCLVALITTESSNATPEFDDLNTFLEGMLPDYMRPSCYYVTTKMPVTANGKIDRRRLNDASQIWRQSTLLD